VIGAPDGLSYYAFVVLCHYPTDPPPRSEGRRAAVAEVGRFALGQPKTLRSIMSVTLDFEASALAAGREPQLMGQGSATARVARSDFD